MAPRPRSIPRGAGKEHRMLKTLRLVLGVLFVTMTAWTATADDGKDANGTYTLLEERPDRLIATLPNRLVIIAQRVPTQPVVSVQTWVKTGSVYEQEHVGAGLSHFLEHLLSGGTTSTRTEAQSNAILGEMGAQINAATSLDNVHYYINTTAAHAETAVDLLSDWMLNNLVTEEEFTRERDVIQREFAMGEGDPGRIFWKLTQQARYTAHPGRHPTIGYLDEFLSITRDGIYDFYKRMYAPNNTVFVVVGDIEPRAVVDQVARLWADEPARDLPELSFPVEPEIESPRELSGTADIQRPRLRMGFPGTRLAGELDYELDLLSTVLGSGESSRLVRTVRDELGIVTSIDAYNLSFHWGEGYFGVDAEISRADAGSVDAVRDAVMEQIARLREEPVTEAELDRAKRKTLAAIALRNQTVEGIASRLASDLIATGDPDYLQKYAEKIQSLTPADLRSAAQKYLVPDRLITVTLLPRAKDAPAEPLRRPEEVAEAAGFEREPVTIDNTKLLTRLGENLRDAAEARAVEVGATRVFRLDNGLRVIVERNTTVPGVAMQMYWLGGLLGEEPGREGVATAVAAMRLRGTETRTAQEIAEAIEDLGARVGAESGANTEFVTATALSEDWPAVMDLMADVILRPSFPADEWERIQPRILAAIARQGDTWNGELSKSFRRIYFGENHPWSQTPLGRAEVVEALTPEALRSYNRERLGAENAVLVVVGDVEAERVKAEAQRLFEGLPAEAAAEFKARRPDEPTAKVEQVLTNKPVAAVAIGFGPGIERSNPDYARLQVLSTVMSDFPAGWLEQELRGRGPGLAYAVGAYVQTGLVPGYFGILFNTQTPVVNEAVARSMGVVERAKAGDISDADLQRAKAKVLTEEFFGRQGNARRAAELALDELYDVDDPAGEKFLEEVESMDAETVAAVAKKYLRNPVVVVLTNERIEDAALDAAVRGELVAE